MIVMEGIGGSRGWVEMGGWKILGSFLGSGGVDIENVTMTC